MRLAGEHVAGGRRRWTVARAAVLSAVLMLSTLATGWEAAVRGATSALVPSAVQPIHPAAEHVRGTFSTNGGQQVAHLLRLDPRADGIDIEAVISNDRVTGLETVRSQVLRSSREGHRVVAALNADVWSGATAAENGPSGLHVQAGELLTADISPRVALGVAADGSLRLGAPALAASIDLPSGIVVTIDRINKSRRTGNTILFTPRWGPSTLAPADGIEVVLDAPGLVMTGAMSGTFTVVEVRIAGNSALRPGQVVLSADGFDERNLVHLRPGDVLPFRATLSEGWTDIAHAVGGREWILRGGQVDISPRPAAADQRHPRTAVGLTANGTFVAIVVDGRTPGYSTGVTLPELGQILLNEGVVDAINLDGGGSSTFLAREPGEVAVSVANRPSDGRERAVTNAIAIVSTIPTGPLAAMGLRPGGAVFVEGSSRTFTAFGRDVAWNPVALPGAVAWSVSGPATVDARGVVRAAGVGEATVTARVGDLSAEARVTILRDRAGPVVVAPVARPTVKAQVGGATIPMTVAWSATDAGLGVAEFRLRRSVDFGPWTDVPLAGPTATSVAQSLAPDHAYRFSVLAVDAGGNTTTWTMGPTIRPRTIADAAKTIRWTKTWRTSTSPGYLHGSDRWATAAGARARFAFTGKEVAWVAAVGPNRGRARVYVDGAYAGIVDLRASKTRGAMIVFRHAFATRRAHTIEIRVVGTRGRPRIDVDGFVVVNP